MTRSFRSAAVYLALAAMLLRGLLPAGWMPAATATNGSLLAICTMQGPALAVPGDKGQQKHPARSGQGRDICPFAAAPHFATPPLAIITAAQIATAMPLESGFNVALPASRDVWSSQSPRAPPFFA